MSMILDEQSNDLYWYWFVNLKGSGSMTRRKLLQVFGHPSRVFHAGEKELSEVLKKDQLAYCMRSRNKYTLLRELKRLSQEQTRFIHWESAEYPEKLRQLPDPPYGLYLRGRLPDPNLPSIAMIGSRRATEYGKKIAEQFARYLAGHHIQIISGLAEGIDTASHRGALRGYGYTLGVLGGGIDSIYPRENFNLYRNMYQKGGVLSEWNLGIPNQPGLFPIRNRLISGLSDAVFVLEAARKSGTFITVDQALEQGRTVFALPGRITDVNSIGTNQLISDGAIPVLEPEDIISYFEMSGFPILDKKLSEEKSSSGWNHSAAACSAEATYNMSEEHLKIVQLIDENEPRDFDYLLNRSGYGIGKLSHILMDLELSGKIYQPNQNIYMKT